MTGIADAPLDNGLWSFSLELYVRPGVSDAFIDLQDRLGLDVNMALFSLWLGLARGMALTPAYLASATSAVRDWHQRVVHPLRDIRRELKVNLAGMPDAGPLRTQVKRLELTSEQIELAALAALSARWPEGRGSVVLALANLEALLRPLAPDFAVVGVPAIRAALSAQAASAPAP